MCCTSSVDISKMERESEYSRALWECEMSSRKNFHRTLSMPLRRVSWNPAQIHPQPVCFFLWPGHVNVDHLGHATARRALELQTILGDQYVRGKTDVRTCHLYLFFNCAKRTSQYAALHARWATLFRFLGIFWKERERTLIDEPFLGQNRPLSECIHVLDSGRVTWLQQEHSRSPFVSILLLQDLFSYHTSGSERRPEPQVFGWL